MRCVAVATDAHGQRPLMTLDLQRYDLCSPLPLSELRGEVMRTPQHIDEIGIARHNFAFGRLGDCPARSRHRSLESVGAGQRRVDAGGIGIFKLTALAVRGPRSLRVTLSNTTVQVCQAAGNSAPIMAALRTEQLTVPAELGGRVPGFHRSRWCPSCRVMVFVLVRVLDLSPRSSRIPRPPGPLSEVGAGGQRVPCYGLEISRPGPSRRAREETFPLAACRCRQG